MGMPKVNAILKGKSDTSIRGRSELVIGVLPNGDANSGKVFVNVQTFSKSELDSTFGVNTHLRLTIEKFLAVNRKSKLRVQTIEEELSYTTSASGKIAFSGAATKDGKYLVSMISDKDFTAEISVLTGDTDEVVATKVENAFKPVAMPKLPAKVTRSLAEVTATANTKSTIGNTYGLKVVGEVEGLTVSLTGFSGGSGAPAYAESDFPAGRVTGVLVPSTFTVMFEAVKSVMEARFNSTNLINDGVTFYGLCDSYSNISSALATQNTKTMVIGNKLTPVVIPINGHKQTGPSFVHPVDFSVAEFMAIRALRLELNAPVADYVIASGKDNFGGKALASLPYHNTPLAMTPVTPAILLFDESEKEGLEALGYTVIDVNDTESAVVMGATATNYKYDELGLPSDTFKYLEFVDTGSVCREYIFNFMKQKLAQSRATGGDLMERRNMHNEVSIAGLFMDAYEDLGKDALVQMDGTIVSQVLNELSVSIDLAKRTAQLEGFLPIVTQIGTVNMALNLVFKMS